MLSEIDEQRLVRAIDNAERGNRGEVRVHVEARCPVDDPLVRARAVYRLLGMDRTRDDTAVLLYVAERSRRAAVYGGAGIHPHAGEGFWQEAIDAVAKGFRKGKPADGLVSALDSIGDLLREHVPGVDSAGNELPNAVTRSTPKDAPKPVDEAAGDELCCVNCGAPLSIREADVDEDDPGALLEQARCRYCDTVNDVALALLRKRRAVDRHDATLLAERQRRWGWVALGAAASVLLIGGVAASQTQATLGDRHAEVERARAQVRNVRERQAAVRKRYANAPPSPDRDASLSGAENRVRIERARYDEAAAKYNATTRSSWNSLVAKLTGMPPSIAMSDEVSW